MGEVRTFRVLYNRKLLLRRVEDEVIKEGTGKIKLISNNLAICVNVT